MMLGNGWATGNGEKNAAHLPAGAALRCEGNV